MAKKSYKWLSRLIDKITKSDCPNNNYFMYYGHHVTLESGTPDYVSVNIAEDNKGSTLTSGRKKLSLKVTTTMTSAMLSSVPFKKSTMIVWKVLA